MKIEKKIINGIPQTFLIAKDGMIITDGKETYGSYIRIAEGISETDFYEITEEEYRGIMHKELEAL